MFVRFFVLALVAIVGLSAPLAANAQPVVLKSEDKCKNFDWLLGTWQSYNPWGDQMQPTGGTLIFTIGAGGMVEGRIGSLNDYMEEIGYRSGQLVYRGFHEVTYYGPDRVAVYESFNGQVLDMGVDGAEWREDSIGVRPNGILYQSSTAFGDLAGPYRKMNSRDVAKCNTAKKPVSPPPELPAAPTNTRTAPPRSGTEMTDRNDRADEDPQASTKKCNYSFYQTLVGDSTGSIIAQFDNDIDEVATYDPDMPAKRMYPSPISGAADIPVKYMDLADYRALTGMEEITEDVVAQSGPDSQLVKGANTIRRLFGEARQSYDLSAQLADQRQKSCPKFSDPDAYPKITEADAVMNELRKRRDEFLKPRLAEGDRLNEKLTRLFYKDIAETNSLDDKQKQAIADMQKKVREAIESRLTGEAIEPRKIETLVPQLEALRESYSRREAQGAKVSQKQRDRDLKEALKRSGIDYDPSQFKSVKRDGAVNMGKAGFDYLLSTLGPKVTGFGQHLSTAQSYIAAAKVSAEVLNAMKNFYTLFGTEYDLLPVALATKENRAYLAGLVGRYDLFEQEYAILRKNFENAVTSGGTLSETD